MKEPEGYFPDPFAKPQAPVKIGDCYLGNDAPPDPRTCADVILPGKPAPAPEPPKEEYDIKPPVQTKAEYAFHMENYKRALPGEKEFMINACKTNNIALQSMLAFEKTPFLRSKIEAYLKETKDAPNTP